MLLDLPPLVRRQLSEIGAEGSHVSTTTTRLRLKHRQTAQLIENFPPRAHYIQIRHNTAKSSERPKKIRNFSPTSNRFLRPPAQELILPSHLILITLHTHFTPHSQLFNPLLSRTNARATFFSPGDPQHPSYSALNPSRPIHNSPREFSLL